MWYLFLQDKLSMEVLDGRMDFSAAFSFANHNLKGEACIVANADIFFDHTLARLFPHPDVYLKGKVGTFRSVFACNLVGWIHAWTFT
jgi:hypothetical protein